MKLQGAGWLLIGLILGPLVAWLGVGRTMSAAVPAWSVTASDLFLGAGIFATCCALHFRTHLMAVLTEFANFRKQINGTAARIDSAAADLERSAYVVADNLAEVRSQRPDDADLYLAGALAHAARLPQIVQRLRHGAGSLTGRGAPMTTAASDPAER